MGWGAEVLALISGTLGGQLQFAARIAAQDLPVPASVQMEETILPSVEDIIQTAQKMV